MTTQELYDRWLAYATSLAKRWVRKAPWIDQDFYSAASAALWDAVGDFDPERGTLQALIVAAVNNRCNNRLKAERCHNPQGFRQQVQFSSGAIERAPSRERPVGADLEMADLLGVLKPRERKVVEARMNGETFVEIGATLNLTPERIRQIWVGACEYLQAQFEGEKTNGKRRGRS